MLHGQMMPGQMSLWHMESVQDGPRNLPLKFGPNRATNSWDIYCSGWVELVAEPMCRVGGVGCGAYVSVGEIENKAISTSIDLNWIELNWGWAWQYSWYGQMLPGEMLHGQMSLWHLLSVKDGSMNLPLKFSQNQVSNTLDIPYMDKCRQDKCCLDKCPSDRWHLLKMVQGTYL